MNARTPLGSPNDPPAGLDRRELLTGLVGTGAALGIVAAAGRPAAAQPPPPPQLLPAPLSPPPPQLDRAMVDAAVAAFDGVIASAMEETGIPGLAAAVIYGDEVLFAKGFGVREVGKPEAITPDTVFLLASVSKPIASTIVAGVVGRGDAAWTMPAATYLPALRLSDPYVTAHATIADFLSHRSGLSTGAGDELEDLGFDRDTIVSRLYLQPLDPFRSTYHYSNFGFTLGGLAAAAADGRTWEDLADETLFRPLGMSTASYRHADYLARPNRARPHVRTGSPPDSRWEARFDRNADAEAPAGGASGSLSDLIRFVRLQLGRGTFAGQPVIDADALDETHRPQQVSAPAGDPAGRSGFYGLGWNVSYGDSGMVQLGHSGGFELGAATVVSILPGQGLGLVVLTNAQPIGVPEAVAATFVDMARHGHQTVDWLGFIGGIFAAMMSAEAGDRRFARPPANPAPARPLAEYAGAYRNDYYGPLAVTAGAAGLTMTLGPAAAPRTFPLAHFDGDTFTFEPASENGLGTAGATFASDAGGSATLVLDMFDPGTLATFRRP